MFRAAVERNPAENPDSPAPPIDHIVEAGANQQIAADRAMADRTDGRQPPKAAFKYWKFDWRALAEHKLQPILRPFKPMVLKNMNKLRPTVTTYQELKQKESNVDACEKLIEEIETYEYQVYQEQEKQQRQTEEVKQEDKDSDAHPLVIPLNPEELRINECLESLKKIFTMIDEGWLRKCIEQRFADKWDLEKTTSWIFDNLNVAPRKHKLDEEPQQLKEAHMDAQRERLLNTIRDVDNSYEFYAHVKLTQKFNRISLVSLKSVQRYFRYMYLPSVVLLAEGIARYMEKEDKCWYDYRQDDLLLVEITLGSQEVIFPLRINDRPKRYNMQKLMYYNCPEIPKVKMTEELKQQAIKHLQDESEWLPSQFAKLEHQTNVPREQLAGACAAVISLYLVIGHFAQLVCNFIGFAYPAFASMVAIESGDKSDDTQWLTYWTVYTVFSLFDFGADIICSYFPLHWLVKCASLIYLYHPLTFGAKNMYFKFARPWLFKFSGAVAQAGQTIQEGQQATASAIVSAAASIQANSSPNPPAEGQAA